eukprot:TRINITY_DN1347_c0_g1_i2.p1 TRINITY_DN1347_c0_g1~~TRINITY_DN1347_c0_g1_i2.p1  ORF type:complete len:136 (-),score=40.00 TRINITY_DN1347_c0_g1_i2:56-463(-)
MLIPHYVCDCAAAMVVYDITSTFALTLDKVSFGGVRQWINDLKQVVREDARIIIIGNKADLSSERQVKPEEGAKFAEGCGALFYEASAKDGTNVEEIFNKLITILPGLENMPHHNDAFQLKTDDAKTEKKSSCCR